MRKWGIVILFTALVLQGKGQADPYLMGRACMIQQKYDSAVYHLEQALSLNPGETEILYNLGVSNFQLNKIPEAQRAFYEVEKRRKGMGSLYLARSEVRLNHPEQALKYLRIHLSSRYRVPFCVILLDTDLSQLELHSGWQGLWNEKRWYNQADQLFQEALYMKENDNALEAINLLNQLEEQGYKRSEVQAEKAGIYASLGNDKAAFSALSAATRSDVRNLEALSDLARMQLENGSAEDALIGLNRLIRQDPARFEAYLLRAEARSLSDDLNGAREDMDTYLYYFPAHSDAFYRKGMIEFRSGKFLNAIQAFNSALDLNKGKAEYYFARGKAYASTGTVRYAEKDMSMALDLDPFNGEIWYEKGQLSEQLGNIKGACHCFQKAFQYGVFEAGELYENKCR